MMQNFACNCLNVRIRAAPANSMNPDELNSALRAIEQDNCPEFKTFVQKSHLAKIGHEPIQIRHPFLCGHRSIGNGWCLCICSACDLITHAIRVGDEPFDLDALGSDQLFTNICLGARNTDGLVLVNSMLLNDDDQIDSLRSSQNFSPVFDIIVPPAQLTTSSTNGTSGTGSGFGPNQPGSRLGSVGSIDWTPPSSLNSGELVPKIVDNVRDYLKRQHEAKDVRIRDFLLEQERAFDALCHSVQISRVNFVHLVESLRRRHCSAELEKENRPGKITDGELNAMYEPNLPSEIITEYGISMVGTHPASNVAPRKEHENYYATVKNSSQHQPPSHQQQQQQQQQPQSQQQQQAQQQQQQQSPQQNATKKQQSQPKRFARSADYDDGGLFQMDDIDVEHGDFETVTEEPEDELPDVENDSVSFVTLSQAPVAEHKPQAVNQLIVNSAGDRIRKVSNIQNVPFSYRANRDSNEQFNFSLPIPIPVHLRAHPDGVDDDNSTEEGDVAARMLKMASSVREREIGRLEDRPRRRLNTCDLIDSSRLRAMYE